MLDVLFLGAATVLLVVALGLRLHQKKRTSEFFRQELETALERAGALETKLYESEKRFSRKVLEADELADENRRLRARIEL